MLKLNQGDTVVVEAAIEGEAKTIFWRWMAKFLWWSGNCFWEVTGDNNFGG